MQSTQLPIHLTLRNRGGSVEHYYHYLFGYLLPLALTHNQLRRTGNRTPLQVRSCSLMDKHTKSIGFEKIEIVDKQHHASIAAENQHEAISTPGFDNPAIYCRDSLTSAAAILASHLSDDVTAFAAELDAASTPGSPRVVVIDRDPPHPFYQSPACEIKSAGTDRRSIPNFTELATEISCRYPNTASVTLENKPLAYQIALFQQADIIVSQHGATLANLIWSKPDTHVVEIHPTDLPEKLKQRGFFSRLTECLDLNYHRIDQAGCHSEVDIDAVCAALETAATAVSK